MRSEILKPLGALWRRLFPPKPGSARQTAWDLHQAIAQWKDQQREELARVQADRDYWAKRALDLRRVLTEHAIQEPAEVLAHDDGALHRPDIHPRRRP